MVHPKFLHMHLRRQPGDGGPDSGLNDLVSDWLIGNAEEIIPNTSAVGIFNPKPSAKCLEGPFACE